MSNEPNEPEAKRFGEETFSEEDLRGSSADRARSRSITIDRVAATVGILCAGLVVGGMVALGACAAPAVFELAPAPYSGNAMGAAFARFDRVAIGASCVALGAEVVRTFLTRRQRPRIWPRIRRLASIGMAGAASAMGLYLSPLINDLHQRGAHRGPSSPNDPSAELNQSLEQAHARAETLGKLEVAFGLALIGLHVFTLRRGDRDEDEEEDDLQNAVAPLPPGPASKLRK